MILQEADIPASGFFEGREEKTRGKGRRTCPWTLATRTRRDSQACCVVRAPSFALLLLRKETCIMDNSAVPGAKLTPVLWALQFATRSGELREVEVPGGGRAG